MDRREMKIRGFFLLCVFVASSLLAADKLDRDVVLTHMDQAAGQFHALSAQLTYTRVTVIVNDTTTENGNIYFQKEKNGSFKILMEFTNPESKTVLLRDGKARIFRPKINRIEEYDVGKNRERMEQFLLLGFGGGGHNLLKSYNVKVVGEEKLGGTATVKLELTPKGNAASQLKRVELWLSENSWEPAQQIFTEPSGDSLTSIYREIKESKGFPDSRFKINAPANVEVVKPGAD
jgi:outer membrane lipoprotein-sorting protein